MAWIETEHPAEIGESEWSALLHALAPVSEGYLRRLLRESGVPLGPVVAGVRQDNLESLEQSLRALESEYEHADTPRQRAVRRLVIEAKDHARWAAKRHPEIRAVKEEMILWMLTWLENPPLFGQWLDLRKQTLP